MNLKIQALIESISESLVLWDGNDGVELAEKFNQISVAANSLDQAQAAEACTKASKSLANLNPQNKKTTTTYLEQVVTGLQNIFMNGYKQEQVFVFQSENCATIPFTVSNYVDKKILSDFLSRQDTVLEQFESCILEFEKQKNLEALPIMLRILHTLKGESALLGLSEVERVCHSLEGYLSAFVSTVNDCTGIKIDVLLEAKDWFQHVVRFLSGKGIVPDSADLICNCLLEPSSHTVILENPNSTDEVLSKCEINLENDENTDADAMPLSDWIEVPIGADASILADFLVEAKEHLEVADLSIMSLETDPKSQQSMNTIFRAFHSIKGVAAFLEMKGIRTLAHEVETLLDKVRGGKVAVTCRMIDVFLESVDAMRKIVSALQGPSNHNFPPEQTTIWNKLLGKIRHAQYENLAALPNSDMPNETAVKSHIKQPLGEILVQSGSVTFENIQATLKTQKMVDPPPRLGELLVKEGLASAIEVTQALRNQRPTEAEPSPNSERTQVAVKETVKVEADRLDRLLDAIGELVIAESMIVQSNELKGKVTPLMAQRLAHLDKITRGLQQMGTSLRMVPIRPIFQKMTRLVRDLGKKHNKAIEFITYGDETELDKTVVEKIGDPLVHMVRNAVDHGIESDPSQRIALGKPGKATLTLSAFQKGGNICIKLEDDGRGLNRDAILAKARENGLIRPDAVMEDRDVWQLIFEPGFSTAKEVTETSGRGVGMDVVKRNVQELRGRIDIQSQSGIGTSFSIWLPLTLAIIDGMIVRLGKERFIFPTLSILRIVPLVKDEIHTVIDKGEMLKLQDEMIPLLRLNQIYPGFHSLGWSRLAVIVESDGQKVGIPVDELLGQQQIVIKGLGESFKNIAGLTGGAILSDGMVGMILDVDGLMKYIYQEETRVS